MTRPRLIHYASAPLASVHDVEQKTGTASYFTKPRGLWVSAEGPDDWAEWCESEQFNLGQFAHATEVVLGPGASIWRLKSEAALWMFTQKFGREPDLPFAGRRPRQIDWAAVAEEADGIVIAPYQWGCRMDDRTSWYYGWDCASGCIWRASAVAELRQLSDARTPVEQRSEVA